MEGKQAGQSASYGDHPLPLLGTQHTSPADSPTGNATPTSPGSQRQLQLLEQQYRVPRQLRPMKSPLYVPAALRPTERPGKCTASASSSPMTPPKSLHGSTESLEDQHQAHHHLHHGDLDQGAESAPFDRPGPEAGHEWIADEILGQVTGEPSKEHWKADAQSPSCDSPACRHSFNLFRRRHHCRHCGHIFCSEHAPQLIPLDQQARFHPDGFPSRACDTCYRHYRKWEQARQRNCRAAKSAGGRMAGDGNDSASEDDDDNDDDDNDDGDDDDEQEPEEPEDGDQKTSGSSARRSGNRRKGRRQRAGGLISSKRNSEPNVGSVPRDWAWSTF